MNAATRLNSALQVNAQADRIVGAVLRRPPGSPVQLGPGELRDPIDEGRTVLHIVVECVAGVAERFNLEGLLHAYQRTRVPVDTRDTLGKTALMDATSVALHDPSKADVIDPLIAAGASPYTRGPQGMNCLHRVLSSVSSSPDIGERDGERILQALLAHGSGADTDADGQALIDQGDDQGHSPLYMAITQGLARLERCLLDAGAHLSREEAMLATEAEAADVFNTAARALATKDNHGLVDWTLSTALKEDRKRTVSHLLENGLVKTDKWHLRRYLLKAKLRGSHDCIDTLRAFAHPEQDPSRDAPGGPTPS